MTGIVLALLASGTWLAPLADTEPNEPILEAIEWTDIWVPHANENKLPRVLLVGDSITRGYYRVVERGLAGKAYCARFATSMFLSNPDYLDTLKILLRRYDFAVIHINNGLHGFGYSEQAYAAGLEQLLRVIRSYAPRAVVIWAQTTPVRTRGKLQELDEHLTARVRRRNELARAVMQRHGIAVNDLFSVVADHPEYFRPDGVHYTARGYEILGARVRAAVLQVLEQANRQP